MEWFWQMVDHFQKSVAGTALQNMSPIDWFFLLALLWGLIQGSRKGFSEMFGKLLGILLVSMLTLSFYEIGAEKLIAQLSFLSLQVARPFSFFLLSVFLWISVAWVINIFGKFLRVEAQGILKTLGGMFFGILRMILLLSFIVQFLLFLPIEPVQQIFKQGRTYTAYTISRCAPDLHKLLMSSFHKPVSQKISESVKAGG